jgi:anti-anti-sigma regulatory factor
MTETSHAAAESNQWHLIGRRWRPLQVQLAALETAATWARVEVEAAPAPGDDGRRPILSPALSMASAMQGQDYAVVVITGEVTGSAVHQVRCHLDGLVRAGIRHLVVDVAGITACDMRLGGVIDRLHHRLGARHGDVVVVNAPLHVRPVFEQAGAR